MQLFSKEKGTVWGITNGLLLAAGVGFVIAILAIIVFGFSGTGILTCLGFIGIDALILFIINTKFNLLDSTYPFSRKFFNMLNILNCFGWCIALWAYIVNLGDKRFDIGTFLVLLVPIITYIITVVIANAKPIMISSNSKALNAVNFFSLSFCSNIIAAILMIFVGMITLPNAAAEGGLWRLILFLALILAGLIVLIYCLNFRKRKNPQPAKTPKAFNVEKKEAVIEDKTAPVKPAAAKKQSTEAKQSTPKKGTAKKSSTTKKTSKSK